MKNPLMVTAAVAALLFASGSAQAALSQAELDRLAEEIDLRFAILDNNPDNCPSGRPGCFLSEIQIRMPERLPADFRAEDLRFYFSYVSTIAKTDSDQFEVEWVNGDLNALKPKRGARLRAGETYRIKLWGNGHFYSAYYVMPNIYLASGNLTARTIRSTRPVMDPETGLEILPFVPAMTDEKELATGAPGDQTVWLTPERAFAQYSDRSAGATRPDVVILPAPMKVSRPGGEALDLRRGVRLVLAGVERSALQPALNQLVGAGVTGLDAGPELRVEVRPGGLAPESYRITTTGGRSRAGAIHVRAADAAGASHALRSLAQQVAHEQARLRPIEIEDSPRFPFRGLHVDVARNFHSKAEILKLIEQMATYKLNRLHLHLGEDEGWRLEIKALPELAEVGGFRCHDPSESKCLLPQLGAGPDGRGPVNGYYTQADYLDILGAAKARHIEVIPSFDMPGHSRAAIRAMEARYRRLTALGQVQEANLYRLAEPGDTTQYRSIQNYSDNTLNVCMESTYRFLDKVIDEVAALHSAAGMPLKLYHIGADETAGAWSQSPSCQALMKSRGLQVKELGPMFIERVSQNLARKGIATAGWSDGLGHTNPANMPKDVQTNIWGNLFGAGVAEAHTQANHGWRTVISNPEVTYFDSPYVPDPLERGYDWPSRSTDTFKVFSFMPENLAANASVMKNLQSAPATVKDTVPLQPGRKIHGLQGQVWSETIRSDAQVEYMLFPRLLALAERAWRRPAWEPAYKPGESYSFGDGKVNGAALASDWRGFASRMGVHLGYLDAAGVEYRLAPPGARLSGGQLEANSEFPGTPIEYRLEGGSWTAYAGPVAVAGPAELRTRTPDGRRASRSVRVAPSR